MNFIAKNFMKVSRNLAFLKTKALLCFKIRINNYTLDHGFRARLWFNLSILVFRLSQKQKSL